MYEVVRVRSGKIMLQLLLLLLEFSPTTNIYLIDLNEISVGENFYILFEIQLFVSRWLGENSSSNKYETEV